MRLVIYFGESRDLCAKDWGDGMGGMGNLDGLVVSWGVEQLNGLIASWDVEQLSGLIAGWSAKQLDGLIVGWVGWMAAGVSQASGRD